MLMVVFGFVVSLLLFFGFVFVFNFFGFVSDDGCVSILVVELFVEVSSIVGGLFVDEFVVCCCFVS